MIAPGKSDWPTGGTTNDRGFAPASMLPPLMLDDVSLPMSVKNPDVSEKLPGASSKGDGMMLALPLSQRNGVFKVPLKFSTAPLA
jgi:hypothetical protein